MLDSGPSTSGKLSDSPKFRYQKLAEPAVTPGPQNLGSYPPLCSHRVGDTKSEHEYPHTGDGFWICRQLLLTNVPCMTHQTQKVKSIQNAGKLVVFQSNFKHVAYSHNCKKSLVLG